MNIFGSFQFKSERQQSIKNENVADPSGLFLLYHNFSKWKKNYYITSPHPYSGGMWHEASLMWKPSTWVITKNWPVHTTTITLASNDATTTPHLLFSDLSKTETELWDKNVVTNPKRDVYY